MSCTKICEQINTASLLIVQCRYDEAIAQLSSMLDPLKLALTVYDYSAIINPKEDEKASTAAAAAATTDDEETHAATNAKVSSSATVRPRRGAVAATKTTSPSQRREEEAVSKLAYKFYTYQFESPFLKTDIPDTRARRRGGGGRGNNSGSGSGTSRPTRTTGTSRSTRSTTRSTTTNNANPPPQELPPPPHEPKPSKPKFVTASIYRPPLLVQIVEEDARLAPSLGTTASSAASVSFAVNMKKVCEMLSYVAIYNLALCHQMKVVQLAQQEQAEHQHQQQQQLGGGGAMTSRGGDTSTSLSGAAALLLRGGGGGGFRSSVTARKRRKRMLLCLKKALGLYEHSHQILMNQQHHEELATGSKNTSHFILHKMVLVTNLGQIHHSLKDHAKGDLCMDHLVAIVTNVKQKEEPVVDTIFEGSRVMMQGFFTIAAPYTTRHDHAAAA